MDCIHYSAYPSPSLYCGVIGWVIYKLVISRVIERDLFTSLLATFGIAIIIAQILNLLFGSDTQSIALKYDTLYFADGFIDVPIAKLLGVLMAAILAIGVIVFMKFSRMGQAIRATAQDARAARVMGINTEKIYAFTFSLNSAICGAAGAIVVMVWVIQPFYGITHSIRSFVIVTAAGLGNLPGVIAAGLGIGALEQYGAHIFRNRLPASGSGFNAVAGIAHSVDPAKTCTQEFAVEF